jgi:hypothetical protein
MTPKEYYYGQFRKDFKSFWSEVPHRQNYVTGEPIFKFSGLIKDDGRAIDPLNRGLDALRSINKENHIHFLSALGCTVLIDQAMFTHFAEDYKLFQSLTQYPKMHVGWINANPWSVFHTNVRLPRSIHKYETRMVFRAFAEFFVSDLEQFFIERASQFKLASWNRVRRMMLSDSDVVGGAFGEIFGSTLSNNKTTTATK